MNCTASGPLSRCAEKAYLIWLQFLVGWEWDSHPNDTGVMSQQFAAGVSSHFCAGKKAQG